MQMGRSPQKLKSMFINGFELEWVQRREGDTEFDF
jgi:hypothetical protein